MGIFFGLGSGIEVAYGEERGRGGSVEVDVWIPWDDCAGDFVAAVCSSGWFAPLLGLGCLRGWRSGHDFAVKILPSCERS